MRVIVYLPDYGNRSDCGSKATRALSDGMNDLGVEHSLRRTRDFDGEIADVAIVNGWTKSFISRGGQKNRNPVIAAQAAAGKPAWCLERGFLLDREEWSALSIGGFCAGGDFRAEGMPSDRWDALGIELQPWRTGGEYVLLCAQVPWDAQVDDGNHLEWLENTVREIRANTDRPILFRPHPKAYRHGDPYRSLPGDPWREMGVRFEDRSKPPTTTFEQDLKGAHAVVCYNSNVAVLSTIAGVPVFTGAPCLADPIACSDLSYIEHGGCNVFMAGHREQWSWNLAYRQWNLSEFREAKPWLHLTR